MEMTPEEFRDAARRTAEWVLRYREAVAEKPVKPRIDPGDVAARIPEGPPEKGEPFEAILADMDEVVEPGLTHWNHPRFFAYFPSNSSAPGVLAEFLAAALNQNAMLWRTAPAATEMEERMTGWVRELVGLPSDFEGVILDTASTSSFTALLAAREETGLEVRRRGLAGRTDLPPFLLYVSEQGHSSLEKAAMAAGLGRAGVRRVLADEDWRMDPGALDEMLREDREAGRMPVMVCATVGTTSTAAVDPVDEIADVCEEHDVWLHVDAAYAGPAAMVPELRDRFAGWGRADSVVLNPHKWMATPLDCSVLLFRDRDALRRSLALTPEYLESDEGARTDLMDFGLPLGRRFRALKLWFLIRWYGAEGLRSLLRSHVRWARGFAEKLREDTRFELAAPPSFSTVCFRALPPGSVRGASKSDHERYASRPRGDDGAGREEPGGERPARSAGGDAAPEKPSARPLDREEGVDELAANELNRRLLRAVNDSGEAFLSHTELSGSRVIRLAVGGPYTRQEDVRRVRELLGEKYDELTS